MQAFVSWLRFCGRSILQLMSSPIPYQPPGSLTTAYTGNFGASTYEDTGETTAERHTKVNEIDHHAETKTMGRFNAAAPDPVTTHTTSRERTKGITAPRHGHLAVA